MRLMRALATLGITVIGTTLLTAPGHARSKSSPGLGAIAPAAKPATKTKTLFGAPVRVSPRPLAALLDPPPNDQCSGAIPLPCGNISLSGSTFMATNDYNFADTTRSCTGYSAQGRDVVYSVNAQAGDSLWLDYTSDADGSIYVVSDCDSIQTPQCIGGADEFPDVGATEYLRVGFPANGTYYVILDSYSPDSYGDWTLAGQFISCGLFPPANDRCATATKLFCSTIFASGSTETAFNDYHFTTAGGSCANATAHGRDVVYRLDVNAGDSLAVYYTSSADGVMYIIADCAGAGALCFVGTNETGVGGQEAILHRFVYAGTYYLVLDSEGGESFGTWNMFGSLTCNIAVPSNDRCDSPTFIHCGPFYLEGSTALATNEHSLEDTSCTGFETDGNDIVFRLDVSAGDSLWVNYRNTRDGSIYLITDCANEDTTCVLGVDIASTDEIEYLRYLFPTQGIYYLILDSYEANLGGDFTAVGELICPQIAGVDPRGPTAGVSLRSVAPNPFMMTSTVRFTLPERARMTLRIYDLAGRLVRTLLEGDVEAGDHAVAWDGKDDQGVRVEPGTYYARLADRGRVALAKLIFVQ